MPRTKGRTFDDVPAPALRLARLLRNAREHGDKPDRRGCIASCSRLADQRPAKACSILPSASAAGNRFDCVLGTQLPRQPRARVRERDRISRTGNAVHAFQDGCEIPNGDASPNKIYRTPNADTVIRLARSLTRSACSFGNSLSSFCTSPYESSSAMLLLSSSVRCVDSTVAASTTV